MTGALAMAGKPCQPSVPLDECVRQVDTLWRGGDAIAAGTAAELLLERARRDEEAFVNDGARIAFIAAIGRYVAQSQPAAEYWLWVAARHESECGQQLPPPYRQVVDVHGVSPGEGRATDREIRRSPFLAAPSTCLELQAGQIDLRAVADPDAPAAIVIFGRARRDRTLDGVGPDGWNTRSQPQFLFEYPAESVSAALEAMSPRDQRGVRPYLESRVIALTPCTRPLVHRHQTIEICRADQPAPASQ
ncbi:hypothetical protein AB6B38_04935 [Glycocaulis abyssi]|uniref:Uncharacterized protein n=1 Tax=Glycocaulis abyssi TaxID=1433403 RepID=A0ABV9NAL3_9PROT